MWMRLAALVAALMMAWPAAAQVSSGRLVMVEDFPSQYVEPRRVHIWLPAEYDADPDARFPVLYMHDGQNLFEAKRTAFGEWGIDEAVTRLAARGDMRPTIVVGVENSGKRYDEYFPQKLYAMLPPEWQAAVRAASEGEGAPFSDRYLKFLVEEVKPRIDRDYRTLTGPKDTSIMGSSMGALISIYAVGEYPQVFGQGAGLSMHLPLVMPDSPLVQTEGAPAQITGAFEKWLATTRLDPKRNRIYIDRGSAKLDAHYARFFEPFAAMMARRGWGIANFDARSFTGAEHNETAWRERVDIPLIFLDRD